eukprot:8930743-Karenia_brevis.AAC.1
MRVGSRWPKDGDLIKKEYTLRRIRLSKKFFFGPTESENKRKESNEDQVAPEGKRRRTQEEED